MSEIFAIHSTIELTTADIEGGLRRVDSRAKETSKALEATEKRAQSLGKATNVQAREFERLSEKLQNAKAKANEVNQVFSRGEASYKQVAQALNTVGRASDNVSSKIKDINARFSDFQASKYINELKKIRAERDKFLQQASSSGGLRSEISSQLGIPLTPAQGLVAGAAAVGYGAKKSLDAAADLQNAQQLLSASAKEIGKSYSELAEKADKFGKINRLSSAEAVDNFSRIANFAGAANRLDKLDQFSTAFSNLAAAKGIKSSELGEIAKQLNALTDEATDKLLNANPSAFYDKYAASVGKTADSLTDAEKRAAVFDEVIRRGAIFNGEAEKRALTYSGQIEKLNASWTDFIANIGKPLSKSATGALIVMGAITGSDLTLFTDTPTSGERTAEATRNYLGGLKDLRTQQQNYRDAQASPKASYENYVLSQLRPRAELFIPDTTIGPDGNLTKGAIEEQYSNFSYRKGTYNLLATSAADNQKAIAEVKTELDKQSDDLVKGFTQTANNPKLSLQSLLSTKILFESNRFRIKNENLADSKAISEISDSFAESISNAASKGYQKALSRIDDGLGTFAEKVKATASFKKLRLDIQADVNLLPETKDDFLYKLNKDIAQREKAIFEERKKNLRDFATLQANAVSSATGNPLVRYFNEAENAIQAAYDKFKDFDVALANNAAALTREAEAYKLNLALFDSRLKSLDYRQEAQLLGRTPAGEINGTQRKLTALEQGVGLLNKKFDYMAQGALANRLAADPYANTDNFEALSKLNNFNSISSRFDDIARQLGKLGPAAEAILAQAKLAALPNISELTRLAQDRNPYNFRQATAARNALGTVGSLNNVLAKAQEEELKKLLQKQQTEDFKQVFVQQKLNQLEGEKSALFSKNPAEYYDRFLNLTNNISELTPKQFGGRIEALDKRAGIEDDHRKEVISLAQQGNANLKAIVGNTASMVNLLGGTPTEMERTDDPSNYSSSSSQKSSPADVKSLAMEQSLNLENLFKKRYFVSTRQEELDKLNAEIDKVKVQTFATAEGNLALIPNNLPLSDQLRNGEKLFDLVNEKVKLLQQDPSTFIKEVSKEEKELTGVIKNLTDQLKNGGLFQMTVKPGVKVETNKSSPNAASQTDVSNSMDQPFR